MTRDQSNSKRSRRWLWVTLILIAVLAVGIFIIGSAGGGYTAPSPTNRAANASPTWTSVPPTHRPESTSTPPPAGDNLTPTREGFTNTPRPTGTFGIADISSPTVFPNLSPDVNATATADSFNVIATQYALSATPVPTSVSLLVTHTFTVIDKSGTVIGNGQIRVYAPARMAPGEQNQIRVEIEALPISTPPNVTVFPQPTATPALSIGTSVPTVTPLPLVGINFLIVHEYMLIELQSVDPNRFTINAIPPSRIGIQRLYTGVVNRWIWGIVPSKDVTGINTFAVSVELPRTRDDGVIVYDPAINPIQFQITVDAAPITFRSLLENISLVAGVIGSVAAAIGAIYSFYRFLRRRANKAQSTNSDTLKP